MQQQVYYTPISLPYGAPLPIPDRVETCGLYQRQSHQNNPDEPSIESQRDQCRAWAERARLIAPDGKVVGLIVIEAAIAGEIGDSGSTRRPAVRKLLDLAERGVIRHCVVMMQDRLGRGRALGALTLEADEVGLTMHSVLDPFDRGIADAANGLVSGEFRKSVARHTQRGRRDRAVYKHKPIAGCKPGYGYRWDDPVQKNRYIAHDLESAVMVRAFDAVAYHGVTLTAMCAQLMDDGVPAPKGGKVWNVETLSKLIHHDRYVGEAVAFGQRKYLPTGRTRIDANGRAKQVYLHVERPDSERVILPEGTYPALVSRETAAAARAAITRNKSQAKRNNRKPEAFLLRSGFIYCGACGEAARTVWKGRDKDGNATRPYYVVEPTRQQHQECGYRAISQAKADGIVWDHVVLALNDDGVIAAKVKAADESDPYHVQIERLTRQREKLAGEKDRLWAMLDRLDDDLKDEAIERINAKSQQLRGVTSELDALLETQAGWRSERRAGADFGERVGAVRRALIEPARATYAEKRIALEALGVRAYLQADNTIVCEWAGKGMVALESGVHGEDFVSANTSSCGNNIPASFLWTDPHILARYA